MELIDGLHSVANCLMWCFRCFLAGPHLVGLWRFRKSLQSSVLIGSSKRKSCSAFHSWFGFDGCVRNVKSKLQYFESKLCVTWLEKNDKLCTVFEASNSLKFYVLEDYNLGDYIIQ